MKEITKEHIEALGLRTDDYMSEFYEEDGCYHSDLESAVWCGVFGFCGCGDCQYELERLYATLEILKREDRTDRNELYDVNNGYQIYLYLLDRYEFTEHGSSIYGSWLTDKGEALYKVLNYILDNDPEKE